MCSHAQRGYPFASSAAILCTGGLDVIRKEAWPLCRTSSGVRLCWELEEPKGPKVDVPSLRYTSVNIRAKPRPGPPNQTETEPGNGAVKRPTRTAHSIGNETLFQEEGRPGFVVSFDGLGATATNQFVGGSRFRRSVPTTQDSSADWRTRVILEF